MHHQMIEQYSDIPPIWIETWSYVEHIGFWNVTLTRIGGEVNIWVKSPPPREAPSEFWKFVCRLFLFVPCAIANWWYERQRDGERWPVDRRIEIGILNIYYDESGREIYKEEKHCIGVNRCTLHLSRIGFGLTAYPSIGNALVVGVRTFATIKFPDKTIDLKTWEADGVDLSLLP